MAALRRIQVVWDGIAGSPYLSTFHFSSASSGGPALAGHVNTFLQALKPYWCPPLAATIQQEQIIFDEQTGTLLAVESVTAGPFITGTSVSEPLPYATQGVLRLGTGTVVAGRRLQGRFFVPSPPENQSSGVPLPAYTTAIQSAGITFITNTATAGPWTVWSRPVKGSATVPARAGTSGVVTSVSAWNKWGVQRRRRD